MEEGLHRVGLVDVRYDVAEWVHDRSVRAGFHVAYKRNRYSVPHRYAGRKVDLRVGEETPSACRAGERIAAHRLLAPYVRNGDPADESHMPEAFLKPEWDDARIRGWARRIGPSCAAVVERIFSGVKAKEQACSPALSVLRLAKRYGEDRLEAACAHALPRLTSPRYRHLKAILDSSLEGGPAARGGGTAPDAPKGHVRGADYYYRELG